MRLGFNKEDLFTLGGFVLDSYTTYRLQFEDIAPDDYHATFLKKFGDAREKLGDAPGAQGRTGTGKQVTGRLYENMDKVRGLLNKLQIRLDLVTDPKTLTVVPADFKVVQADDRLKNRDAEGGLKKLATLAALIADNLTALKLKGYKQPELTDLNELRGLIDTDNKLQNLHLNTSVKATALEDADYQAVDNFIRKVRKTAVRLFKGDKLTLKEFPRKALLARVHAGEKPKRDGGSGGGQ